MWKQLKEIIESAVMDGDGIEEIGYSIVSFIYEQDLIEETQQLIEENIVNATEECETIKEFVSTVKPMLQKLLKAPKKSQSLVKEFEDEDEYEIGDFL